MKDYRNILKSNTDIDREFNIDEERLWDTIENKIKSPKKNKRRFFMWWFLSLNLLVCSVLCFSFFLIERTTSNTSPNNMSESDKQIVYSERNTIKPIAFNSHVQIANPVELISENQKLKVDKSLDLERNNSFTGNSSINFSNKEEQNNSRFYKSHSEKNPLKSVLLNNLPKENEDSHLYNSDDENQIVDNLPNDNLIDQTSKNIVLFADSEENTDSRNVILNLVNSRLPVQSQFIEIINQKSIPVLNTQLLDKDRMTLVNNVLAKSAHKLSLHMDLSVYNKSYSSKTKDLSELFNFKRKTEIGLEGFNLRFAYSKSIFHPNLYFYSGLTISRLNEKLEHSWLYTDSPEQLLEGQSNLIQVNATYFNYYQFINAPLGIEYDLILHNRFSMLVKAGVNINLYKNNVGEYFDIETNTIKTKNDNVIIVNNKIGIDGFHLNMGIEYVFRPKLSFQAEFGFNKYSNEIIAATDFTESFFICSFGVGASLKL